MQRTDFSSMACSIARAWSIVGEPWTPLILRDIMLGVVRFDQIRRDLGVSRNVLSERLRALVDAGILQREAYSNGRTRYQYAFTPAGAELAPILMALQSWGDRWCATSEGPPLRLRHDTCGKSLRPVVTCSACKQPVRPQDVKARRGPGLRVGPGTHLSNEVL